MNNGYDTKDPFLKNFYEISKQSDEISDRFKKIAEALRRAEHLANDRLVKAIGDAFAGPKDELEKAEPVYDISWIRKRMKCCKNPMERRQLEKQLNAAYKARKKNVS